MSKNDSEVVFGKLYYDSGELQYEGYIKDDMPHGNGIKYYKSGQKQMEGLFADWFVEKGKEYYENGNLKFEGDYNTGPRTYYGPRYYVSGKLYYDTGELWYEGTFNIERFGSIGYPIFKGSESFSSGVEYDKHGNVIKTYFSGSACTKLRNIIFPLKWHKSL